MKKIIIIIEGFCQKNIGKKGFEFVVEDLQNILGLYNIKGNIKLFFDKVEVRLNDEEKPKKTSPKIAHSRTKTY